MSESNQTDWTSFAVGQLSSRPNWTENECQPLDVVDHVTHLSAACDIIRHSAIRAGLVYDKSQLNTKRILVNWLSPNKWHNVGGSRYGPVAFRLSWASLVRGKRYYWVGSMGYSPTAVRILVTDRDRSRAFPRYDPTLRSGPWWHDAATGSHYWNGRYCLEVMLERDVELSEVLCLDGVDHHKQRCNVAPRGACPEAGFEAADGRAHLIAALVAWGIAPTATHLFRDAHDQPSEFLCECNRILLYLRERGDPVPRGNVVASSRAGRALARAVIGAFVRGDRSERRALLQMFASENDLIVACRRSVERHFGLARDSLDGRW